MHGAVLEQQGSFAGWPAAAAAAAAGASSGVAVAVRGWPFPLQSSSMGEGESLRLDIQVCVAVWRCGSVASEACVVVVCVSCLQGLACGWCVPRDVSCMLCCATQVLPRTAVVYCRCCVCRHPR
jgi:hypothetical protein